MLEIWGCPYFLCHVHLILKVVNIIRLRLIIKVVVDKMRYVHPNAIIIDKHMSEFNALKKSLTKFIVLEN